jgi:hypothetical protein
MRSNSQAEGGQGQSQAAVGSYGHLALFCGSVESCSFCKMSCTIRVENFSQCFNGCTAMANKQRHSTRKSCNLCTYHKNNGLYPDKTASAYQEVEVGTGIDTKTVYKLAYSFVSGWAMPCTRVSMAVLSRFPSFPSSACSHMEIPSLVYEIEPRTSGSVAPNFFGL